MRIFDLSHQMIVVRDLDFYIRWKYVHIQFILVQAIIVDLAVLVAHHLFRNSSMLFFGQWRHILL